jgi:uroporphyrinogen-III synthase
VFAHFLLSAKINLDMSKFSTDKTYALFESVNNKKILAELFAQNIETVIFPTITTNEFISDETETLLKNLGNFDWLIFPDVYTAEYFIENSSKNEVDLFELDSLRVCAYGEAVSDRLRFSQLHADVIPPTIKTLDVLQAIKEYVFDEDEFENLRFLILKENDANLKLTEELESLKAFVIELPVYTFEVAEKSEIPRLKALLKGGAIDEFIFSSHLDVINLAQFFPTENLTDLLKDINLTAINDSALKSLQEFRLLN